MHSVPLPVSCGNDYNKKTAKDVGVFAALFVIPQQPLLRPEENVL